MPKNARRSADVIDDDILVLKFIVNFIHEKMTCDSCTSQNIWAHFQFTANIY